MQHKPMRGSRELRQRARDLRQEQTTAEIKLWHHLRGHRLAGYKFRRQHPIERVIVDFYYAEQRLVIEVDGPVHGGQEAHDQARTAWLAARGYRVIRFTNRQVLQTIEAVLDQIVAACR